MENINFTSSDVINQFLALIKLKSSAKEYKKISKLGGIFKKKIVEKNKTIKIKNDLKGIVEKEQQHIVRRDEKRKTKAELKELIKQDTLNEYNEALVSPLFKKLKLPESQYGSFYISYFGLYDAPPKTSSSEFYALDDQFLRPYKYIKVPLNIEVLKRNSILLSVFKPDHSFVGFHDTDASEFLNKYMESLTNEAEKSYYQEYYNGISNMISEYSFLRIDKILPYGINNISQKDYNINEILF